MKLSEFTFRDSGSINCNGISNGIYCDDCPIKQFTKKKGYLYPSDFVKAKGLIMKIDPCTTVYHYIVKLEKLEKLLSL